MSAQDRFQLVEKLFRAAAPLEPEAREAYLAEACGDDVPLRKDVESLLRQDQRRGALDTTATRPGLLLTKAWDDVGEAPPPIIPGYIIVREIGHGGMGVVYEAEQQSPRRRVALKILHPGLISPRALKRFGLEVEVLGRLRHPGIAQVFEAGTFDHGAGAQPFFAMEYIEGTPLSEHLRTNNPPLVTRLRLLCAICDAVEHAHRRGVIHRDLKPGNILVDSDHHPWLLDFGIARATEGDIQLTTIRTDLGQIVGTVPYMSPEQAAGNPDDLDTRSDVYALGVVAYEMLSGKLPYDVREKMIYEAVRVIREDDPTPISRHHRALPADVETIIHKALAKEKDQRYGSAAALADDVRRYLRHEPIAARPPSAWYQARKFAHRNRVLVTAGALVSVAIIALAVVASVAAVRERGLRRDADDKARVANAISDFLANDLLAKANPSSGTSPDVLLRDLVDDAAAGLHLRFPDDPLVEASLRTTIVDVYTSLGLIDTARPHFDRTRQLLDGLDDVPAWDRFRVTLAEISLLAAEGDDPAALMALDAVLPDMTDEFGPNQDIVLDARTSRAVLLQRLGQYEEAVAEGRATLEIRRRVFGPDDPDTLSLANDLANSLSWIGDMHESETLYRHTLDRARSVLGDDHWDTINIVIGLAEHLRERGAPGDHDEAEVLFDEARTAMEARGRTEEHPRMLALLNNQALLYLYQGRLDDAEPMYERIIEIGTRVEGPEHPGTLTAMHNLGGVYLRQERFAAAAAQLERCLELRRKVLGSDHPGTSMTMGVLARALADLGRNEEALPLYLETLEVQAATLGADHPITQKTAELLADLHDELGSAEEATRIRETYITPDIK